MKQGLLARLQPQLALTPQLRHAIRLLQLSTLELHTELRVLAESNPLLELEDFAEDPGVTEREPEPAEAEADADGAGDAALDADAPPEASLQFEVPATAPSGGGVDWVELEADAPEDLRSHLLWQLEMSSAPAALRAITTVLIDALDDDGYLRSGNEDIRAAFPPGNAPDDAAIEQARAWLLQLDPVGVGARNLAECLDAQLAVLPGDQQLLRLARRMVTETLEILARHDLAALERELGAGPDAVAAAAALVQELDPKPGASFDTTPPQYVIPDAYAVKRDGLWQVTLNPDCRPGVRINQHYRALIGASNREDSTWLRAQLQEARWLLKSLESRAQTIAKVATAIVVAQSGFLDFGPEAMRPLVLREVAEAIDMHESTVSRVTTHKYLHTPRGIFEFKHFFSSGVGTEDGGSASATAVQAVIRKLIDAEDRRKPYSDQALTAALAREGIQVARRTVAKYRRMLRIPNSSQRVQLHE